MARDFDVDIDMHLDLGDSPEQMDVEYVCELTERHRYGGRVTIGHVTKMSLLPPERFEALAARLADSGVAVTVLPSTDLFLMGRGQRHSKIRGVLAAHELLRHGVNCSLSTNNVLNPFTPFGDCSLVRMANLYANVCHVGTRERLRECMDMVTRRSATLLRLSDYGVEAGQGGRPRRARLRDAGTGDRGAGDPAARLQAGTQDLHAPTGRTASAVVLTRKCLQPRYGTPLGQRNRGFLILINGVRRF